MEGGGTTYELQNSLGTGLIQVFAARTSIKVNEIECQPIISVLYKQP